MLSITRATVGAHSCPCEIIALTPRVAVAMPLNCSGMYRGVIMEDGVPKVAIFDDEELE